MDESEMVWIASVAFAKNLDYETLKYSDYMYGKENLTSHVWEYVEEIQGNGSDYFYEKYSNYKLY